MPSFLFLIVTLFIPAAACAANLDSLLSDNRVRAGVKAEELFAPLDRPDSAAFCCESQREDYRFLLANLPLSDLALMTTSDLLENIRLAREARKNSGWGMKYDEAMFRNFVLPHRMSQEPFVRYRKQFMEEIGPRVKGLSMKDAVLEVNHWCHEKATYRPTDGRDQDPLTTIRSGFGRCEEEMILCVAALRSVGIPARQCYTPYWAHCDDNHAWVEAWADGQWYYLGACEPAQNLDEAWFSNPVKRAMLVVSSAYGEYGGNEPVLRRYGRATLIASTEVYGPIKDLELKVIDSRGRPAGGVRVIFSLWNYGALMPATSAMTDSAGIARLTCGVGDWFVSAMTASDEDDEGDDDIFFWMLGAPKFVWSWIPKLITGHDLGAPRMGFAHIKGNQTEATLTLRDYDPGKWMTECDYTPPPAPPASEGEQPASEVISAEGEARGITAAPASIEGGIALRDSLFRCRLAWEDSLREAGVYGIWADEMGIGYRQGEYRRPDSSLWWDAAGFTESRRLDPRELTDLLDGARGNWGRLYLFLSGMEPSRFYDSISYPIDRTMTDAAPKDVVCAANRNMLLTSMSEKDRRDASLACLTDYLGFTSLKYKLAETEGANLIALLDSVSRVREKEFVIAPRIDYEPLQPWRQALYEFLTSHDELAKSDAALLKWLRSNITLETSPDRLGPPLTPSQCLELRRGTEGDVERLCIGLCRVRGIPARRNPVSGQVERWEDGKGWVSVEVIEGEKGRREERKKGKLTIEIADDDLCAREAVYLKDWAASRWEGNYGDAMDFGWHKQFKDISWPQELPAGWYLLSSGRRREDGSALAKFVWVEVKAGRETRAILKFR